MSDITVYTCVTGAKDRPQPTLKLPHLRHVLFADEHTGEAEGWDRRGALHPPYACIGPSRRSMYHRWNPTRLGLTGSLMWVDGNFRLLKDPTPLFEAVKREGSDIGVFAHPNRTCVYEEADEHIRIGMYDTWFIRTQKAYYQRLGIRQHAGLYMTGLLVIPNSDATPVADAMAEVFEELLRFSYRDQIAFPVVAKRVGLKLTVFAYASSGEYFADEPHLVGASIE